MKKPKILIVESEPRQVSRIKELLLSVGAEYIWAKDGGEGMRQALEHFPDLIIANTKLPLVTGVTMVNLMHLLDMQIPTIFVAEQAEFLKLKNSLPTVRFSCWISRMAEELPSKVNEVLSEEKRPFRDVEYHIESYEFLGLLSRHDRKKILLGAEHGSTRILLSQLESEGFYEVYTAHDGREALLKAVTQQPDLIIVSSHLSVLDGPSLARLLYILGHPLPMVILTDGQNPTLQEELSNLPAVKDFWIVGQCLSDRKFFLESVQNLVHLTEEERDRLSHAYREIDTMNLAGTGKISDDMLDDPTLFQDFDDVDLD